MIHNPTQLITCGCGSEFTTELVALNLSDNIWTSRRTKDFAIDDGWSFDHDEPLCPICLVNQLTDEKYINEHLIADNKERAKDIND